MERQARFSIRKIMSRVASEWSGSDLELEIRAGLPGQFVKTARVGGSRQADTAQLWVRLDRFLDWLSPVFVRAHQSHSG